MCLDVVAEVLLVLEEEAVAVADPTNPVVTALNVKLLQLKTILKVVVDTEEAAVADDPTTTVKPSAAPPSLSPNLWTRFQRRNSLVDAAFSLETCRTK